MNGAFTGIFQVIALESTGGIGSFAIGHVVADSMNPVESSTAYDPESIGANLAWRVTVVIEQGVKQFVHAGESVGTYGNDVITLYCGFVCAINIFPGEINIHGVKLIYKVSNSCI